MKRKQENFKRLFHYTIGAHLENIFREKAIKIAESGLPKNVKAAAWMTYSPDWEATCNKSVMEIQNGKMTRVNMDKDWTEKNCGGLFRIEVNAEKYNYTWKDYKALSGIKGSLAKALYDIAIDSGSRIGLWRVSFDPIPFQEWICLEKWDGANWIKINFEDFESAVDESLEVYSSGRS